MLRALNNSMNGNAVYRGGTERLRAKDYNGAIASFTEAIRLNAQLAGAYSDRGMAHLLLKHYDLALQDCIKAVALDPQLTVAYVNRGSVLQKQGNYDGCPSRNGHSFWTLP
ncbi:MAG: hypothetical protein ABI947_19810 [Chloroflexota bacterium]